MCVRGGRQGIHEGGCCLFVYLWSCFPEYGRMNYDILICGEENILRRNVIHYRETTEKIKKKNNKKN